MKRTFLGIGLGPIQTSIFLDGAFRGGFDRLVIAEVDAALINSIRESGGTIQINTASSKTVTVDTIPGIEMYNPAIPADAEKLIEAAAQADEVATALPSITFFKHLGWLKKGFEQEPQRRRFVYAAENHNHAAEELEKVIGSFADTYFLNTVIGKMSGVFPADKCLRYDLAALTSGADRGHLVETFDRILIQSCDRVDERKVQGLHEKPNLLPFEEAKLYGHNAVHALIGYLAHEKNCADMAEALRDPELRRIGRTAFLQESGAALIQKYAGFDPLFTETGFTDYTDDLLERMGNPNLRDAVKRIIRDPERKLGWNDRLIGTIRLALDEGVEPVRFAMGAAAALRFAHPQLSPDGIGDVLRKLWGDAPQSEVDSVLSRIIQGCNDLHNI